MIYRKDKYGNPISILGYGCMRFTKKGRSIDLAKAAKEIMEAYRAGVNYYDTALCQTLRVGTILYMDRKRAEYVKTFGYLRIMEEG